MQPLLPSRPFTATVIDNAGFGLVSMKRGEQTGAAGTEDQDIGADALTPPDVSSRLHPEPRQHLRPPRATSCRTVS